MAAYTYYRPQPTDPPPGYSLQPDPRGTNYGSQLVKMPAGQDYASQENKRLEEVRRQERNWNRTLSLSRLATLGVLGAGAGAAALGGGSAAGSGAAGAGSGGLGAGGSTLGSMYSTPGVYSGLFGGAGAGTTAATVAPAVVAPAAAAGAGGGFSLGALFNSPALGAGVNAFSSWMGGRAQNKANEAAIAASSTALERQIALEQARMTAERENADLDRAAILAQNTAANEMKRRELGASEEERAYDRSISERNEARRLMGARILGQIFGWGG